MKELARLSYHVDGYLIDGSNFCVFKGAEAKALSPRAFDVLVYLIVNRERVVEKQELFDSIWKDTYVTDNALTREIKEIRRVLGDDAASPRYIATVRKRGYRFIAEAKVVVEDDHPSDARELVRSEVLNGKRQVRELNVDDDTPSQLERNSTITRRVSIPTAVLAIGLVAFMLLTVIVFAAANRSLPIASVQGDDFDRLLNAYNLDHAVLTRNCYMQAGFILIGLCLIGMFRTFKTPVPALGVPLSLGWLYLIAAFALLYLWIEFGFVLDDLIQYRAEAWRYLSMVGDPLHDHKIRMRALLFNDAGFIDGWFMCFRPDEHAIRTGFFAVAVLFFSLVFVTLFALNHACIVIGFACGSECLSPNSRSSAFLLRLLPWFSLALILLSHLHFRFGGKHPNWMQPFIGIAALAFGYVLIRNTRATPEEMTFKNQSRNTAVTGAGFQTSRP